MWVGVGFSELIVGWKIQTTSQPESPEETGFAHLQMENLIVPANFFIC